jgi:hypothetical protein
MMDSRQKQRWSLMTVLYLVVRTLCYAIVWLVSCADSKMFYIRYIGIPYSVYVSRPKIGVVLIAHP